MAGRESCISHPKGDPFWVVYPPIASIVNGEATKAYFLIYFQIRLTAGDLPSRLFASPSDVSSACFGQYGYKTLSVAAKSLLRDGWVDVLTDEQAACYLTSSCDKQPWCGHLRCSWCGSRTPVLQSHHYPIRRVRGGTETVRICPNCHYTFHYLTDYPAYRPTDKCLDALDGVPFPEKLVNEILDMEKYAAS